MTRQLPTLPHTYACSTIGSTGLNFSVRNGKRCDPCDSVTEHEQFLDHGFIHVLDHGLNHVL